MASRQRRYKGVGESSWFFLRGKQVVKAVGQLARGHPDGREHARGGRLRQDPRGGHLAALRDVVVELLPAVAPGNHFWLDSAGHAQFSCLDQVVTRYWREPARMSERC